MTTETQQEKDLQLPWDYFLRKGVTSAADMRHIDGWRQNEWKSTVRQLLQEYRWDIPEGLEPHWVTPGKAVYWQEQTVMGRKFVDNTTGEEIPHSVTTMDTGHWERALESSGWEPTGRLPADNASQVAHYLNKGFRLRPPLEGVDAEALRESADLPEASNENQEAEALFFCNRHLEKGRLGFTNWDAYVKHCAHYSEKPTETPPQSVLEFAAQFKWYCPLHNIGYNKPNLAQRHYKAERKKPGGQSHPTVDDMLVDKEPKT